MWGHLNKHKSLNHYMCELCNIYRTCEFNYTNSCNTFYNFIHLNENLLHQIWGLNLKRWLHQIASTQRLRNLWCTVAHQLNLLWLYWWNILPIDIHSCISSKHELFVFLMVYTEKLSSFNFILNVDHLCSWKTTWRCSGFYQWIPLISFFISRLDNFYRPRLSLSFACL